MFSILICCAVSKALSQSTQWICENGSLKNIVTRETFPNSAQCNSDQTRRMVQIAEQVDDFSRRRMVNLDNQLAPHQQEQVFVEKQVVASTEAPTSVLYGGSTSARSSEEEQACRSYFKDFKCISGDLIHEPTQSVYPDDPRCVYTHPEVVGLMRSEGKEKAENITDSVLCQSNLDEFQCFGGHLIHTVTSKVFKKYAACGQASYRRGADSPQARSSENNEVTDVDTDGNHQVDSSVPVPPDAPQPNRPTGIHTVRF